MPSECGWPTSRRHHDAATVALEIDAEDYRFEGRSIPGLSAAASVDDHDVLRLSLCNTDPHDPAGVVCRIRGLRAGEATGVVLAEERMNAHNTFDAPDTVRPRVLEGTRVNGSEVSVELPPMAVAMVEVRA